MKTTRNWASRAGTLAAMLALAATTPHSAHADGQFPAVSPDGLQLVKSTDHGAVYIKKGATFSQYKQVGFLQCYVQFAKDWARNYNEQVENQLGMQITPDDEARIKNWLSTEFNKVFVEELSKKGDFQIATTQAAGVLMLRPALLNIAITAPTTDSPSPNADLVASAGQMTLMLELWDGGTSTLLARVIDAEADTSYGGAMHQADQVSNEMAANIILKSWADRLRKALDKAREAGAAPTTPSAH